MSKIAHYLQEHLMGEVTDSLEVRRYFSTDASILQIMPSVIVYPAGENDVRKTARFSWQLAERGKVLPITARGGGSDTSGAAIGGGIIMSFTAHMNRILTLDPKKEFVTVEPGITFGSLQQTLYTHGLFLPPYPVSSAYATVGGSIANNSIGEKSVKYGDLGKYVEKLSVVLANGEIIETGPLGKRELNKKLGLTSLEGDIYRGVDALLEEIQPMLDEQRARIKSVHHRAGYNIFDVKKKNTFDLTPLFLGSQGTLGIVTEATLRLVPHNPQAELAILSLGSLAELHDILPKLLELKPSVCEMINKTAVYEISRLNPNQLNGILDNPSADIHLIIEFDDSKEGAQKKSIKSLAKLAEKSGGFLRVADNNEEREKINKLRRAVATLFLETRSGAKAVPVAEDVSVPLDRLTDFLHKAIDIYAAARIKPAVWGHAGGGVVRMYPFLDIGQVGDRQRLFKVSDAIYHTALAMEGSISGAAGDGRIRAPYLGHVYSKEMRQAMLAVKKIFDPHGILNRGVKTASAQEVKDMLRNEYSHSRHEHLPHS
ncbi:MAG TPA: FAD-binding oxidoreductase [Candidatus Saccharimonadales bacterium]|nr:FAD-binding oxidoreductase [Candidatus Saccharimonadales bacterium]